MQGKQLFSWTASKTRKKTKTKHKTKQKKNTKNKANITTKNRKAETYTIKTKTRTTEKETAKNESKLDFKKGMLGKFVSNKQANLRKGKGKQKTKKRNPTKSLL